MLFLDPEVIDGNEINLKWSPPKEKELIEYLCDDKKFSEERVKSGISRLKKGLKSGIQGRLDGFFQVVPKTKEQLAAAAKRAQENKKLNKNKNKVTKGRR